jgi:hypothetical protein
VRFVVTSSPEFIWMAEIRRVFIGLIPEMSGQCNARALLLQPGASLERRK